MAESIEADELARRIRNARPLEPTLAEAAPEDTDRERRYPVHVR